MALKVVSAFVAILAVLGQSAMLRADSDQSSGFDLLGRSGRESFDFLSRAGKKRSANNGLDSFDFLGRNGKREDPFDFLGRNGKRSPGQIMASDGTKRAQEEAFDFLGRNGKKKRKRQDSSFDFLGRTGKRAQLDPFDFLGRNGKRSVAVEGNNRDMEATRELLSSKIMKYVVQEKSLSNLFRQVVELCEKLQQY